MQKLLVSSNKISEIPINVSHLSGKGRGKLSGVKRESLILLTFSSPAPREGAYPILPSVQLAY